MDDSKRELMAQTLDDQVVAARRTLLDALEALGAHRDAIILVGAQAIYIHTGAADVALAEFTTDADLAIDTRRLDDDPRIETAMLTAGFVHPLGRNPGVWESPEGIQVDLMVPAQIAGGGRRSVSAPPHNSHAMRKSEGLEAALIDNVVEEITALESSDERRFKIRVAGPGALLIAKLHKLHDRIHDGRAIENKDAHDIYRILVAIEKTDLARSIRSLAREDVSAGVTQAAIEYLQTLFSTESSEGARRAGGAEQYLGDPEQVALAASILASDLLVALSTMRA